MTNLSALPGKYAARKRHLKRHNRNSFHILQHIVRLDFNHMFSEKANHTLTELNRPYYVTGYIFTVGCSLGVFLCGCFMGFTEGHKLFITIKKNQHRWDTQV